MKVLVVPCSVLVEVGPRNLPTHLACIKKGLFSGGPLQTIQLRLALTRLAIDIFDSYSASCVAGGMGLPAYYQVDFALNPAFIGGSSSCSSCVILSSSCLLSSFVGYTISLR